MRLRTFASPQSTPLVSSKHTPGLLKAHPWSPYMWQLGSRAVPAEADQNILESRRLGAEQLGSLDRLGLLKAHPRAPHMPQCVSPKHTPLSPQSEHPTSCASTHTTSVRAVSKRLQLSQSWKAVSWCGHTDSCVSSQSTPGLRRHGGLYLRTHRARALGLRGRQAVFL